MLCCAVLGYAMHSRLDCMYMEVPRKPNVQGAALRLDCMYMKIPVHVVCTSGVPALTVCIRGSPLRLYVYGGGPRSACMYMGITAETVCIWGPLLRVYVYVNYMIRLYKGTPRLLRLRVYGTSALNCMSTENRRLGNMYVRTPRFACMRMKLPA